MKEKDSIKEDDWTQRLPFFYAEKIESKREPALEPVLEYAY